jgi:hypothetical protein
MACPLVSGKTPPRMLIVVVLPAPLGPRKPTISPRSTSNETSEIAVSDPKHLVKRCARIMKS